MIKFDIKHKLTGEVKFTAEIDCKENEKLSVKLGLAVRWGIKNSADLSSADLSSADLGSVDLRYADLRSANLSYANLSFADLRFADLSSADLRSADLRYADLSSADLSSVDLRSADLRSANLRYADLIVFQGFGSKSRTLYAHKCKSDGVIQIRTGCFFGTINDFEKAVKETHGNNKHGKDYKMLCKLIKQKFEV